MKSEGADLGVFGCFYAAGAAGVDLFFVISGFVIFWSTNNKPVSPGVFVQNRIIRLVPAYWIITLVVFLIGVFVLRQDPSYKHLITSLFFLSKNFGFEYPVVAPGWSLEYEWIFYILMAISLAFFKGKNPQKYVATSAVILFLVFVSGQNMRIVEFVAGMAIAFVRARYSNFKGASVLTALGTILILVTPVTVMATGVHDEWLYWGAPSALIVLGSVFMKQANSRFVRLLGDASYATYLLQGLAIMASGILLQDISTLGHPVASRTLITLGLLIPAAVAFEKLVDAPLRRLLRKSE